MWRVLITLIGLTFSAPAFAQTPDNKASEAIISLALVVFLVWFVVTLVKKGRNPAIEVAASAIKAQRRLTASWKDFIRQAKDRADR